VPLHDHSFFVPKSARFQQHVVGYADLAHVVQEGRDLQDISLDGRLAATLRPIRAINRHAIRMGRGCAVFGFERGEQAAGDAKPNLDELIGAGFRSFAHRLDGNIRRHCRFEIAARLELLNQFGDIAPRSSIEKIRNAFATGWIRIERGGRNRSVHRVSRCCSGRCRPIRS